jgi:hypothetical protein
MLALAHTSVTHIVCGNYATANALLDELVVLADGGALFWKPQALSNKGSLLALIGKASDSVQMINTQGSPHCGQREQHFLCLCTYHVWRELMRNSVNSMTPGNLLTKR